MKVKIVSTNSINANRTVGYQRVGEVKFDSDLTAEVEEADADFLVTIDDTLSIVGEKKIGKKVKEADPEKTKEVDPAATPIVEDTIDHVVTEEDMATYPELFEKGVKVGDTIQIPKPKEAANEDDVRAMLEEKSKTVLVAEFGEQLGVTLSMKKEDIINTIIASLKS